MTSVFLAHPSSLEHDTGGHPEQAARITAIERELAERDWLGFERVSSPPVEREILTAVHPEGYVSAIERFSASGGGSIDADTVASAGSFDAALHAAGGAVQMVELLLDRRAEYGFSAHRPPGHHATQTRPQGFCLFNSIAVAAQFALDHRGLERVMIVDWDVHHGNGTNDIFHATDRVLFVSIHQSPLYPGTGPASDTGSGPGEGFTVNVPVAAGTGDRVYRSVVEHVAVPLIGSFEPELVLISAGFDAHRDDPLADCSVTEEGFAAMTRSVRRACDASGVPVGGVLEGGYALGPLARSVAATMRQLTPEPPAQAGETVEPREAAVEPAEAAVEPAAAAVEPAAAAVEPAAEAVEARARIARWWPSLTG